MAFFSPFLIILSVLIAILSAYIALVLIGKVTGAPPKKRPLLISGASLFMGLGIFAMHLIGMSAFHGKMGMSYHTLLLLGSLCISIVTSFFAFHILFSGKAIKVKLLLSGILLGAGIVFGHYIAVLSVGGAETIRFNWVFFILSIAIALLFSIFAIKTFMDYKRLTKSLSRKVISAVVLGMAISLMHYTAMNATVFGMHSSETGPLWIPEMHVLNFIFALSAAIIVLAMLFAYADYRTIAVESRLIDEMRESENRFRKLVELSPEPIAVHSQGNLIFVNEACLKMIGAENKELVLGKSILEFVSPRYHEVVKERIQYMMQGGTAAPIEQQFIRLDGIFIDVEVTGTQMKFEGKPAIQLLLRDITEQKRIRLELEESEQRYQSLFTHNPDGIYSMDPEGRMTNANNALVDLLGYTKEEFAETTFHTVVVPEHLENTIHNFEKALNGEPQNYELDGIHKNGEIVPFHITNLPMVVNGDWGLWNS